MTLEKVMDRSNQSSSLQSVTPRLYQVLPTSRKIMRLVGLSAEHQLSPAVNPHSLCRCHVTLLLERCNKNLLTPKISFPSPFKHPVSFVSFPPRWMILPQRESLYNAGVSRSLFVAPRDKSFRWTSHRAGQAADGCGEEQLSGDCRG